MHVWHAKCDVIIAQRSLSAGTQISGTEFMRKNELVTAIMTRDLVTLGMNQPLSKARQLFDAASIHHLPVVSGEELVGILSWSDFLRISFGEFGNQDGRGLDAMLDHTYKLADVMCSEPVTLPVTATVRDAAQLLSSSGFHSVPIVDGKKLAGLVTSTDLIRYLVEQY
jgi:CBS domain-containing protein